MILLNHKFNLSLSMIFCVMLSSCCAYDPWFDPDYTAPLVTVSPVVVTSRPVVLRRPTIVVRPRCHVVARPYIRSSFIAQRRCQGRVYARTHCRSYARSSCRGRGGKR
jgi:hypothetical protein